MKKAATLNDSHQSETFVGIEFSVLFNEGYKAVTGLEQVEGVKNLCLQ